MKELIGKNKIYKSSFPQKIVIDATEIVGETKIANEFNNFFTNIGPKLAQKIPQPSRPFQSYMKTVNSELENKKVTTNELKEAFFSLKINKSAGFDDMSYNVVKNCFGELSDPLLHIFNLSLLNGMFPDSLKTAKVTPVYKDGDSSNLGNYRPLNNNQIQRSESIEFLGIFLDENLTWKDHIKYVENKIAKNIGILFK